MVKPVISLIKLMSMFLVFIDFSIEIEIDLFFSHSFISSNLPLFMPSSIHSSKPSFSLYSLNYLDKSNKPLSCHIRLINLYCP